jgi:Flp pilus assembly protein TadG
MKNTVPSPRRKRNDDRGAMIVQMALGSIAFLALASLAVDYGVKLIARTEAQRAADAGALAGAVALAFDNPNDLSNTGIAKLSARGFARANTVFGQQPKVDIASDVTFPVCPPPEGGAGTTCVQVDVYRNQDSGNALPTFFSRIVGVTSQGVRATATAKVLSGDTTDCLRPWVVIDRWDEYNLPNEPDYPNADPDYCSSNCPGGAKPSTFDKYSDGKGQNPAPEPDLYVPPPTDGSAGGTGFTVQRDYGRQFAVKVEPGSSLTSGWAQAVDLPRSDGTNGGAAAYGDNILTCSGVPVSVSDPAVACPTDPNALGSWQEKVDWAAKGCLRVQTGNMVGPTSSNVQDLVNKDSGAHWGTKADGTQGVIGSAYSSSPRIVPIAVFDVDKYLATNPSGSGGVVRIVNIYGFFIEGMGDFNDNTGAITLRSNGKSVVGRIMDYPASGRGSAKLNNQSSFLKIIMLVR